MLGVVNSLSLCDYSATVGSTIDEPDGERRDFISLLMMLLLMMMLSLDPRRDDDDFRKILAPILIVHRHRI